MENNLLGLLLSVFVCILIPANGCAIEGIQSWLVAESQTILDTFRGNIWDRSTSNIAAISSVTYTDDLKNGPYVNISLVDSRLVIATNDAFNNYEEYETASLMGFTISFRCTDGSSRNLVFQVSITDTNNNDPQFRPSNTYEFYIAPPIPPGFLITNCANDIIVRDIDLTTQKIDFEIVSGSSLFEIAYDNSSVAAKEFKAALRTTTLIRSISDPITLIVKATDVDLTGDPRRTTTATVKISTDTEFSFPDEPIFSQPFYLATYTAEPKLILQDSISLRQGFDEQVVFRFYGEYSQYFDIVTNENEVSFTMKSPLPNDLYKEGHILLVVEAEREYTSGATAIVVVQLPTVIGLSFETALYKGYIEDNKLNLVDLKLKEGYEDTTITVDITSDYKSYFNASVDGNSISLTMDPLSESIINGNNFIHLQVTATTDSNSTATTIVTLEIIKDDVTTPVFDRNLYIGSYNQETGLNLEQIVLIQGYDSTVNFVLEGEYVSLFEKILDGPNISLSIPYLPTQLLADRSLLVSVRATKPRTVGANTVVQINLPSARELSFEKFIYKGNLEDGVVSVETIILNIGYDSDVVFDLKGDYADYLYLNVTNNEITLTSKEQLPDNALENSFLVLILSASGTNTVAASAIILLEIIKQDTVTPVFSQFIYEGIYNNSTHVKFETISLIQGYDDTVSFDLDGQNAQYFSINTDANQVTLTLKSNIPQDLIFDEKVLTFNVRAKKPRTVGANAAIILKFPQDLTEPSILTFSQHVYRGRLEDGALTVDKIVLESGFTTETIFSLTGDSFENFSLSNNTNEILIKLSENASLEDLKKYKYIVLEIEATRQRAISVTCTVIIDIVAEDTYVTLPVFQKPFYTGSFSKESGLNFTEVIALRLGFDETVAFKLEGDNAQWFDLIQSGNSVSLISNATNPLPDDVLRENNHLLFIILAQKPETIGGRATISISLIKDVEDVVILQFERNSYVGSIENGSLIFTDNIQIVDMDISSVNLKLTGEYSSYFTISKESGFLSINLLEMPEEVLNNNELIILYLEASKTNAISGHTTIILNIMKTTQIQIVQLLFEQAYYLGEYSKQNGFLFSYVMRLKQGFDESVTFYLEGDDSKWFILEEEEQNNLIVKVKDENGLEEITKTNYLIFTVVAQRSAKVGRSVIIITLKDSNNDTTSASFDNVLYNGNLKGGVLSHETIRLTGFTGSNIIISGEFATLFEASVANEYVTVLVATSASFPENLTFIALTLRADSANAVLLLDVTTPDSDNDTTSASFDNVLYNGNLKDGVLSHETIRLTAFTGSNIIISGEFATLFEASVADEYVTVLVATSASFPENLTFIALTLRADSANAVLLLDVTTPDSDNDKTSASFDNVLYNGNLKDGVLSHETIRLTGFTGSNIIISGEFATLFEASVADEYVTVLVATSASFPENLTFIALTLRADSANAVLLLDVTTADPDLPTVTFSSSSYFLWADIKQVGSVGRVRAVVSNGESVEYSLTLDDYLQTRVSITSEGEILLSTNLDKGVYNFKVTGIAQTSRVSATVPVLLRVEGFPECNIEDGIPPLIVLERIEEEPHLNLVVLNQTKHEGCMYSIQSIWPEDQSWLYVDSGGLHAKSIDREHESIAFMVVSQIQVELMLHCDNDDERSIVKRSLVTETGSALDPYNYGFSRWVLANTITYNARRSVVNLIVEDINDNAPIFVGKENEPIYVGYPIAELESTILPRALIILKATDADIGENAAIMYWSEDDNLAVAPTTGYVHVRNNALLENNSRHTVYAIDQNGKGLNGSLDIVVKLLERNQIAVITVRNAFLDNEDVILNELSTSVGYNIRILRTVVISDNGEEGNMIERKRREVTNTYGASLQLFVYGMHENQVIGVDKLISDLEKVVSVDKGQVSSLEDHLQSLETCAVPGQHTALLASTITLASILFILIISIAIWSLIKWRKEKYENFSDANSIVSRSENDQVTKTESPSKTRIDIEELKRSERRLQEMLDAPVPDLAVRPANTDTKRVKEQESVITKPEDTLINITSQPIVIQSFDKLKDNTDDSEDDEFGEVGTAAVPRKSVVTFNENVEKIIHLEDGIDDDSEPDTEVYRF